MTVQEYKYSYGPVPSRRLGKSLGINNIPAKVCTYSCVYCQVGRTSHMQSERRFFYEPEDIFHDVQSRLAKAKETAERVDYLTFVPDGEPTMDINLGKAITLLKMLNVPVGVITNSSLIWREDVREELGKADWVSVKIDSVREKTWHKINRPHKTLQLPMILDGISTFAKYFTGKLAIETMLVKGINDNDECLKEVADFVNKIQPAQAYISIPIRPPAEKPVQKPDEETLNRMFQVFTDRFDRVEYLIGYEGNAFAFTGNIEKDLLSITAVHPMREDAVSAFLSRAGASWEIVDRLVAQDNLAATNYQGHTFYLRKFATK